MSTPIIEINNLHFSYPPKRKQKVPADIFRGLNLSINKGEIFGILGPNGSGKTTLFGILSTLLSFKDGAVTVAGLDLKTSSRDICGRMGVVFQNPSLDKKLTVSENLLHQGHLFGLCGSKLHSRIDEVLQSFGINGHKNDLTEILSGGMRRRVEIAKGLLHSPSLLLMDEPSTGLDPRARRQMWDFLHQSQQKGMTIILTTHIMEDGDHCDRLAVFHKGEVKALGTPDELKSKIGGDVISIQTEKPDPLSKMIKEKFSRESSIIDQTVRVEIQNGHTFIPQLVEAFPGEIKAVTVGKPTLEDVFIRETGTHL